MRFHRGHLWLAVLTIAMAGPAQGQDSSAAVDAPPPAGGPGLKRRNTAIALGLFPGAGHFYAGERRRAGAILGAFAVGAFLLGQPTKMEQTCDDQGQECGSGYTTESFSIWLAGFVLAGGSWIYSLADAGTAAERANRRNGLAPPAAKAAPLLVIHRKGSASVGVSVRDF